MPIFSTQLAGRFFHKFQLERPSQNGSSKQLTYTHSLKFLDVRRRSFMFVDSQWVSLIVLEPWYHGISVSLFDCKFLWFYVSFFDSQQPWNHGTMVPWHHGAMAPWYHGTMVLRGTMVPRYHGTMVPWLHGTMVPWYHGTKVQWYQGTMVPW